jgi:hypothetical protein
LYTCGHLGPSDLGYYALWDADWIGCLACRRLKSHHLTDEQNRTCDRCGSVVDLIWPATLYPSELSEELGELCGLRQMVVQLGLCAECVAAEGVTPR